ncbi:MAG: hypothetical protein ACOYN3_08165 [Acidimicrobiia bacterium]
MADALIERQLIEVGERIKTLRARAAHLAEQLAGAQAFAEDARLRGLLAETPQATVTAHDAARHVERLVQAHAEALRSLDDLYREQDALLERLGSHSTGTEQ